MRFECVQCGGCCRQSGALRLLEKDIDRIAEYLQLTVDEFCNKYDAKHIYKGLYYIDLHDGCVFLNENKCTINPAKPFFCGNYIPFVDNAGSPIYKVCQGIGQGKEWTDNEIKERYDRMIDQLVIRKDGDV